MPYREAFVGALVVPKPAKRMFAQYGGLMGQILRVVSECEVVVRFLEGIPRTLQSKDLRFFVLIARTASIMGKYNAVLYKEFWSGWLVPEGYYGTQPLFALDGLERLRHMIEPDSDMVSLEEVERIFKSNTTLWKAITANPSRLIPDQTIQKG